jgi:hypothetical protein
VRTIITVRTVFGLKGSATREESRRMAKSKHEEALAKKQGEAARKVAIKQKKALKVAFWAAKGA